GAPDRPGGGGSASRRRQDAARLEQLCLPTPEGPAQIDEVTGDRARLAGGSKHGPEHVELRRQGRVLRVWVKEEDHAAHAVRGHSREELVQTRGGVRQGRTGRGGRIGTGEERIGAARVHDDGRWRPYVARGGVLAPEIVGIAEGAD